MRGASGLVFTALLGLLGLLGMTALVAGRSVSARARQSPPVPVAGCPANVSVGFHTPVCDSAGNLLPWTWTEARDPTASELAEALTTALTLEMDWFGASPPASHGLPTFVYSTFVDAKYNPIIPAGLEIIPATQCGMGIISYAKYWALLNASAADPDPVRQKRTVSIAAQFGEYLSSYAETPAAWLWGAVVRSSGLNTNWPIAVSAQSDVLFGLETIEPDKVGLAGWALLQLSATLNATGDAAGGELYFRHALQHARVLSATQRFTANVTHAPWAFRVNPQTGAAVDPAGERNGNMVFALRLYTALATAGWSEFDRPADALLGWIQSVQLTADNSDRNTSQFVNFFEDQTVAGNRNSWTALELARYLIESRNTPDGRWTDPQWRAHAAALLEYALTWFGALPNPPMGNVTLVGEQDGDHKAWGGASSKLGAVAGLYACAVADDDSAGADAEAATKYAAMSANNLSWMTYYIDAAAGGCSADHAWLTSATNPPVPTCGGWQEDAHTDVVHNIVTGINALNGRC